MSPLISSRRPQGAGFTLMELMIAMAAASVISLSAFLFYGQYHRTVLYLQKEYSRDSSELIRQMKNLNPYGRQGRREKPCCNKSQPW